ncbi:MAG: cation:proton antiporter [Bacteroidetes bacterium]|nr:cation:proton antiporter [Bacteroidota bacterium]
MHRFLFLFPALVLAPAVAIASEEHHGDVSAPIFEAFGIVLIAALLGRFIANKLKLSTVLGELVIGILLGTVLVMMDRPVIHVVRHLELIQHVVATVEEEGKTLAEATSQALSDPALPDADRAALSDLMGSGHAASRINLARSIQLFSTIGISLLLFMVGLEGSIQDLFKVGVRALAVAVVGVVATLGLGILSLKFFLANADPRLAFFGAATVGSTSAGITARVLKDLGKLETSEAKVTMGAAVFDDIIGLILLAVLANVMVSGGEGNSSVVMILVKIAAFLAGVLLFGLVALPRIIPYLERLDLKSARLLLPFILMLTLCYLADLMGLAMIIGAYFAGLMITDEMFKSEMKEKMTITSLVSPLEGVFVPVFFVLMGMQVDITLFTDVNVILTGVILSAAAIGGKLLAGIFLPSSFSKLAVGWGMVPRGEVVLIFANIGKSMGIIDAKFYTATVIVILATVLLSPIALMKAYRNIQSTQA